MMNADIALQYLIEGNKRYVSAINSDSALPTKLELSPVSEGQTPFAIILGCSDSRVPAEMVFNCGLGELFVVRVAGNVVEPNQIGSIEFACQKFGTQLVVVLGHTHCGAVNATVSALQSEPASISPNLASIVDQIAPAVTPVISGKEFENQDDLMLRSMRANVSHSVAGLQSRSNVLTDLVKEDKLKIVGAEYALESGKVNFY